MSSLSGFAPRRSRVLRWLLNDRVGIRLDFEYEDRENSYERRGVGSGLFMTF